MLTVPMDESNVVLKDDKPQLSSASDTRSLDEEGGAQAPDNEMHVQVQDGVQDSLKQTANEILNGGDAETHNIVSNIMTDEKGNCSK